MNCGQRVAIGDDSRLTGVIAGWKGNFDVCTRDVFTLKEPAGVHVLFRQISTDGVGCARNQDG
jgi:hypothetical protein